MADCARVVCPPSIHPSIGRGSSIASTLRISICCRGLFRSATTRAWRSAFGIGRPEPANLTVGVVSVTNGTSRLHRLAAVRMSKSTQQYSPSWANYSSTIGGNRLGFAKMPCFRVFFAGERIPEKRLRLGKPPSLGVVIRLPWTVGAGAGLQYQDRHATTQ